ncbi:histone deacetylase HDT1-like [Olea europaea var. sylvestris]|uniref:histone deacetylase HDT1-like n=1 Tax=Olea europaea var. sylvestris TaxID=158386 RepID=UPI000C1D74B7|nr:histone deacetylase HDT1-like [Olea europaea var. sylvestris]
MEFWGAEVRSGEPLVVAPSEGMVLHLSQACLGELKKEKGNESVCLFLKVDGKKLVLGTLFSEKLPQQQFDLVFDRDFELSHNWKNGSVYFYGYKANNPFEEDELEGGESDESESEPDEAIPLTLANNGKSEVTVKQEKPAVPQKSNVAKDKGSAAGKQKVKIVEPNKEENPEDDDESSDEDLISEDDDDSKDEDDSDDSDDESDESDEETPKKVEPSKKRPAESAAKTPATDKKAKATPQRTDSKKGGGHVATPHPSKQAGKTSANKPNQQTPKSGGSHTCKSCNRTFNSENGLESHTKAKHSSGK